MGEDLTGPAHDTSEDTAEAVTQLFSKEMLVRNWIRVLKTAAICIL